jgi:cysteine-rich repeat protein
MRTSLRRCPRILLGSLLVLACSKDGGMRVLDGSLGPGMQVLDASLGPENGPVPPGLDSGEEVRSVDGSAAPDARIDSVAPTVDTRTQLCGNGWLDPGEQCDDGNTLNSDGCTSRCQLDNDPPCWPGICVSRTICGNGVLTSNEICDDGNTVAGDGCSANCQAVEPGFRCRSPSRPCSPICGDRVLKGSEDCDDGNTLGGDGCSVYCLTEPGWDCTSGTCVQVSSLDGGVDSGIAAPTCGDGIMSGAEECDLGTENNDNTYGGCTTKCFFGPFCGDGNVDGSEECDQGELNGAIVGKGGCTLGCTRTHYCGDNLVDPNEHCDLGDLNGMKLDTQQKPTLDPAGIVYCTADCQIPFGGVF